MNPIVGLPKSAEIHVLCDGSDHTLEIKNHLVIQPRPGIFSWLINVTAYLSVKELIDKMQSNGFRFDAVIEQCVQELKIDSSLIQWIIGRYFNWGYEHHIEKYAKSKKGRIITGEAIRRITACKNWYEFYNIMQRNSQLETGMLKKTEEVFGDADKVQVLD